MRYHPPYTLSIEPVEGSSWREPTDVGTDLALAKEIATRRLHGRNTGGLPTRTVAVFDAKGHMVDCFDGTDWASQIAERALDGAEEVA